MKNTGQNTQHNKLAYNTCSMFMSSLYYPGCVSSYNTQPTNEVGLFLQLLTWMPVTITGRKIIALLLVTIDHRQTVDHHWELDKLNGCTGFAVWVGHTFKHWQLQCCHSFAVHLSGFQAANASLLSHWWYLFTVILVFFIIIVVGNY